MDYARLATTLKDTLSLRNEPIALAKAELPHTQITPRNTTVTSACQLWREAESRAFVASAQEHAGCSVGCHVMGLPMSQDTAESLGNTIELMDQTGYVDAAEIANIPTLDRHGDAVQYGPLAGWSGPVDAVVVWVDASQAMLLNEAMGSAHWGQKTDSGLQVTGRPACAAIANTARKGCASLSLGCSGMRLFTAIGNQLSLFVIPPAALATLEQNLRDAAASNACMLVEYRHKQQQLAAA